MIPPNTVIPALSLFTGSPGQDTLSLRLAVSHFFPGRFLEDLPESTQEMVEAHTKSYYSRFQPFEVRDR